MKKLYNTREEYLEAKKNRSKKNYEKKKLSIRFNSKKKRNSIFYVYSHINSKGDLYIGSGQKSRPYSKTRSSLWLSHFENDLGVAIIKKCNTRKEALRTEDSIIRAIGLDKLVNVKHVNLNVKYK